jgi:hypothetical protein
VYYSPAVSVGPTAVAGFGRSVRDQSLEHGTNRLYVLATWGFSCFSDFEATRHS